MRRLFVGALIAVAALLFVYVWPMRYLYFSTHHYQVPIVLRVDRITGQTDVVWPPALRGPVHTTTP